MFIVAIEKKPKKPKITSTGIAAVVKKSLFEMPMGS